MIADGISGDGSAQRVRSVRTSVTAGPSSAYASAQDGSAETSWATSSCCGVPSNAPPR